MISSRPTSWEFVKNPRLTREQRDAFRPPESLRYAICGEHPGRQITCPGWLRLHARSWRKVGVGQHVRDVRDAISCGHICSKLTGTVSASRELNAPLKKPYACRRRQTLHRWYFLLGCAHRSVFEF